MCFCEPVSLIYMVIYLLRRRDDLANKLYTYFCDSKRTFARIFSSDFVCSVDCAHGLGFVIRS